MCRSCELTAARGRGIESEMETIFENSLAAGAEVVGDYLAGLLPLVSSAATAEEFLARAAQPSALFHVALGGGLYAGIVDSAELGREVTRLTRWQPRQSARRGPPPHSSAQASARVNRYSGDPIELDWFRQQAFTVSGIQQQQVLAALRQKIEAAIAGTSGWSEFRSSAQAVLREAGAEISDAQLATVFNTNLASAHGAGKWLEGQAAAGVLPYWQYVTAGDVRVRPAHQLQDGKVYAKNHPYWNLWFPPNGYNCRCTVTEWDEAGLAAAGLKPESVVPPESPDAGFAGNFGQLDDLLKRLVSEAGLDEYTADHYDLAALTPGEMAETVAAEFGDEAAAVTDFEGVFREFRYDRIEVLAAGPETSQWMIAETLAHPSEVWSWPGRPVIYMRSHTVEGRVFTTVVEVFGDVRSARVVEGTADEFRRGILAHIDS